MIIIIILKYLTSFSKKHLTLMNKRANGNGQLSKLNHSTKGVKISHVKKDCNQEHIFTMSSRKKIWLCTKQIWPNLTNYFISLQCFSFGDLFQLHRRCWSVRESTLLFFFFTTRLYSKQHHCVTQKEILNTGNVDYCDLSYAGNPQN